MFFIFQAAFWDKFPIHCKSVSSAGIGSFLFDWHLHDHPKHCPVAFPCLWQSSLQVLSAAQRANCLGDINWSLQTHSVFPSWHVPPCLPRLWHVASQNFGPRLHRDGSNLSRLLSVIDFSLQLQSSSWSQTPLVWPNATQLAVQAALPPILHLKPVFAIEIKQSKSGNVM